MAGRRVISFDLDGTLLCDGSPHLVDPLASPLLGPFGCREDRLRLGALPLLRGLASEGIELWIYTQSLRGKSEVTDWFISLGIPLSGYVNLALHEKACEERGILGRRPLKSPHWFGIDVHVDDDAEVARELEGSGCRVLVVAEDERDFEGWVRSRLEQMG